MCLRFIRQAAGDLAGLDGRVVTWEPSAQLVAVRDQPGGGGLLHFFSCHKPAIDKKDALYPLPILAGSHQSYAEDLLAVYRPSLL